MLQHEWQPVGVQAQALPGQGVSQIRQCACQSNNIVSQLLNNSKVVCRVLSLLIRVGGTDKRQQRVSQIQLIAFFAVNSQQHVGRRHVGMLLNVCLGCQATERISKC